MSEPGISRAAHAPRAAETPTVRPVTGATPSRPESCLPSLSSFSRGFETVPFVRLTAASAWEAAQCAWIPVSQRNALTSGIPGPGCGLPTG